jgi:penicillin amidase
MLSKLGKFLVVLVSILVVLSVVGGLVGNEAIQRSFPQTSGEIKLAGLNGPVDVYRDKMGIPQIYAGSLHDLFMAQGYVHAQERFWQMDFWRHIGSGRLSEMFGKSQVETDSFLRTLGWRQLAEQEWAGLDPESKAILSAYSDGVNAYLNEHSGMALSLEYGVLGLLTPSYKPEPWTPINSLTWAKAMAWDLRGNMDEEIERALLLKTLTPAQVDELFPQYPADHPLIVPDLAAQGSNAGGRAPGAVEGVRAISGDQLAGLQARLMTMDSLLGRADTGIGSNSWAISGRLSATGKPLLANDPHLAIQMPSIWFQIGLHCLPKSVACSYEVAGFSFAGVPGVIIGHNERIAWGFTNTGPDVMDLYIEKINPNNPNQYEVDGKWVDMAVRSETIAVGGGDSVQLTVRSTRHGPIISDTYGPLEDKVDPTATPFKDATGLKLPEHYAIALRWTALEPGNVFQAVWGFNKAQNFDEFRQAAHKFVVPAQNLVYADVDGNIGYQMPGSIPIRKHGDGRLPVPGWTDDYEWTGYIPFDKLPYAYNPPEGYIVTANNQVPPGSYPYLVTTDWDYGFRAARLVDLVKSAAGPIDIATIQKMQGDDKNLNAATLVPVLTKVKLDDPKLAAIRDQFFTNWDEQDRMDSPSATLFAAFWSHLLQNTFDDNLPKQYYPDGGDRWFEVLRNIVWQPNSFWWDDARTPGKVETRDDIFAKSFADAVDELKSKYGGDPAKWPAWGAVHTATFRNGTLGKSGIAPIEGLFNRGPFQVSGGKSIVNATAWNAAEGYEVTNIPSMRMIVDLGNLDNSLTVHSTGESGHAYAPHYYDMVDLWRNIQYYPMLWGQGAVTAAAVEHLRLIP